LLSPNSKTVAGIVAGGYVLSANWLAPFNADVELNRFAVALAV
jgi:hypothetical protein